MIRSLVALLVFTFSLFRLSAQVTFPSNGAPFHPHSLIAFVNANIVVDADHTLTASSMLVQDEKIIDLGPGLKIPAEAIVYDLKGKYIYPSFIDLFSNYGLPSNNYDPKSSPAPQMKSLQQGAFGWNMAIRSGVQAHLLFHHQKETADDFRKSGIGCVLTSFRDGIVRGSGTMVLLNSGKKENQSILSERCAAFYSFDKGSSTQDYPSSLTGAIALLRQSLYDARWYAAGGKEKEYNITLEELNRLSTLPAIFEVNDKYNAMRAAAVSKEFNMPFIVKAGGNEYQRINDIKKTGLKYILPLNYPEAIDVEDPFDAENISFADLKHWELAPTNAAAFESNFIPFAFTSADLKDKGDFLKNIRKAVLYGLSEKAALKALTSTPASFAGLSDKIGSLKKGMLACFFIASKSIFEEDAVVIEHWTAGERNVYADLDLADIRGNYDLGIAPNFYRVSFTGDLLKPKGIIKVDTMKKNLQYNFIENTISFSFVIDSAQIYRASGQYKTATKNFEGRGQRPDGTWFDFEMRYVGPSDTSKKETQQKKTPPVLGKIYYPFEAYGQPLDESNGGFDAAWNKFKNRYSAILIKNATIWTNVGDSILRDQDVYIVEGKIVRIAPNIDAPKLAFAKIIDAKGKHLTPGIIDEHSHIALYGGVNEGAEASSAEVRMSDVVNPEDINIYRQLSGGVTTAQLLHGSANPIGGQSAIIKLRWGSNAQEMLYEKADGFIKFALGENVKQSNWGDLNVVRFPQSRMGVEQVFRDYFIRAKEYSEEQKKFATAKDKSAAPRRDLELDALAEILDNKRFITCHSYVQSEVNMLLHVADSLGFKVNTFTHILEGYKVGDKLKNHNCTASTFSDWWAYKNEVMEAIPYNAALLTRLGVNTCINSDDAEMARRLNQEAAKSVKYGALTETEALKLVTLNPAKALHISDKVGTIAVGKIADLVLWTDHPLSVYAIADKTIIDGQIYFDRTEDAQLRNDIRAERARLIAKLFAEKQKGTPVVKPKGKRPQLYHCNTIEGVSELETGIR